MIDRRAFLGALGLLASTLASDAAAQGAGRLPPRIGVIWEGSTTPPAATGLRLGLRELGYTEGQNILLEVRLAPGGAPDQVSTLAAELVASGVDVLVVMGTPAAQRAKAVTATVPIVFTLVGDPVGSGIVASLARPGGNATGLSNLAADLSGKQLEILRAAVPRVQRIGVLHNPNNRSNRLALAEAQQAARTLAMELHVAEVRRLDELTRAFSQLTARRVGALLVLSDAVLGTQLADIARLAGKARLPAITLQRAFAEAGGLFAFGPSFTENLQRAASYVDKILKAPSLPTCPSSNRPSLSW